VAVGGDSAGGNRAASVALRARDAGLPLAAQLLLYAAPTCNLGYPSYTEFAAGPVLTRDDITFYWDQYLPRGVDRMSTDVAPLHAADHRGLAPAFVASPELDPTRDATEAYGAKLAEAGCEVFMKRYTGLPHGFYALVAHVPAVQTAMAELTSWLRNRWQKTG
jgi:acetyl esterase